MSFLGFGFSFLSGPCSMDIGQGIPIIDEGINIDCKNESRFFVLRGPVEFRLDHSGAQQLREET